MFLSASFLFNQPTLKAARHLRYVIFCGKCRQESLRCDKKGTSKHFKKQLSIGERNRDTTENAILQCMDCDLGLSGATTDDLFNGFHGVVSCNCETRKLCAIALRRI